MTLRTRTLAAAGIGIVAAVLAWSWFRGGTSVPRAAPGDDADRVAQEPPGLVAGRPQDEAGALRARRASAESEDDPSFAPPADFRPRLVRSLPDGRTEDVEAPEVRLLGRRHEGKIVPGQRMEIRTPDSRVAFPVVRFRVPSAPTELVLDLPSIDDPTIQTLVVTVVDAETKAPLPDAAYTFEDPGLAPLHADAEGRIRFAPVKERHGRTAPGLFQWLAEPGTLCAPGHLSLVTRSRLWQFRPWGIPPLEMRDLDEWRRNPDVRIALPPLPRIVGERRVRVLEADGRPADGLVVAVRMSFSPLMPTSAEGATDGVRHVGPTGEIQFPMREVVGLDLRKDGQPLLSLRLHASRWPTSGAREVRLPPIADVEAVIEAPNLTGGRWEDADDSLGAARTPVDDAVHPVRGDPEAAAWLDSESMALAVGVMAASGPLLPKEGTLRLSFPLGEKRTLRLTYGEESRLLPISASKAGPTSVRARWFDLPRE